jgi:hypothetical protein
MRSRIITTTVATTIIIGLSSSSGNPLASQ